VKMLALGICRCGADSSGGREVYFDSKWNTFDFIIVITGLIDLIPGLQGGPVKSLRTFRVLRPLRAINKFPRMRILVKLLLDTIPMLASVGMLCFLIFFVFGIVAVQFYSGLFHQRCFDPSVPRNSAVYATSYYQTDDGDGEDPYICSMGPGEFSTGLAACSPDQGVPAQYSACRKDGPIPLHGAIHYDNILSAWVVLFQIITLEGWVDQMYFVQGAYSFHTGWIFFCALVVIGAFFAVNLALVVISSQFSNSKGSEMAQIAASEARAQAQAEKEREERKARGEKLSCWEKFRAGELCSKSSEQLEEERCARQTQLEQIHDTLSDDKKRETVEADLDRLQQGETFPITEAEAYDAQGGLKPVQYEVRRQVLIKEGFSNFIMAAIALNVLLMATEHHDQPQVLTDFLDIANYIFCGIFALELVLKMFACGPAEYFSDGFNQFDFVIVVISFVEIGLGGGGLSVLRMLRLVRIFKLVKFLPELQRQIQIMGETFGSVLSFLLLLALFIFIFAILGMFIFGGNLKYSDEDDYGVYETTSRKNFDTLLWALVTIFQTLTLEDWNAGMYDGVRGLGTQWAALYYILLIMLGNYIMFNLFVAILIDGFGDDDEGDDADHDITESSKVTVQDDQPDPSEPATDTLRGNPLHAPAKGRRVSKAEAAEMLAAVANFHANPSKVHEGSGVGSGSGKLMRCRMKRGHAVAPMPPTGSSSSVPGSGNGSGAGQDLAPETSTEPGIPQEDNNSCSQDVGQPVMVPDQAAKYVPDTAATEAYQDDRNESTKVSSDASEVQNEVRDNALCCLTPDNCFRKKCVALMLYPRFDHFVMACILLNSICMAIERPSIQDGSTERTVLDVFGHIFTFIFSLEFIIKVCALGLFRGPNAYWKTGWNRLDGTIVWVSWLDLILTVAGVTGGMLSLLKICRMLRALRPLRAISRLPGLRRIVNVLILSLAPIGTTLIIVGVFFFLFAVLGGQLFAGQFYYCDEGDRMILKNINTKQDCIDLAADGVNAWKNQPYNFDHLGNSLMTLFVLSSIDGWVEIMYLGVDIAGVDMQPQENNSEYMVFFFIFFLLLGGFFIINMFVGVIVENFQKHGPSSDETQTTVELEVKTEPEPEAFEDIENYSSCRRLILAHATSTPFETFIAVAIILNVVVMGSEHYDPSVATYANDYDGMSSAFKLYLRIANYIFTTIFVYELVVKYVAFGCKRYHCGAPPRSLAGWNNFDLFIVVISLLGILFDDVIGPDNLPIDPSFLRILRILRVARILKLLRSAKDLVILLQTVSRSLAQVGNLGLLLFLLFFIYSALGIELFGKLACTDTNPCDGISDYANYDDFGMAMLVLFRLSTGDNWNGMMKDGLRLPPPAAVNSSLAEQYGNEYGCSFAVSCEAPALCCAGCDPDENCKENCCANAVMTPLFYISFCVLSTFVMLNLVVATLMGELERAGNESAEEVSVAVPKESVVADHQCDTSQDELNAVEKVRDSPVEEMQNAKALGAGTAEEPGTSFNMEGPPLPGLPMQTSPELSSLELGPGVTTLDDGLSGGARIKLDPLPMRPVSPPPSVFVPFAPETIADNEPEDLETVARSRVANSDIKPR